MAPPLPPPPLPPPQKIASRVTRPAARYRPGKAPLGASIDDYSDSDDSDSGLRDAAQLNNDAATAIGVTDLSSGTAALLNSHQRKTAGIVISEGGKKLDLRLKDIAQGQGEVEEDSSEFETDTDEEEEKPQAKPVFRKPGAAAPAHQQESGTSEYETDSEEESASEEEAPKPLLKPLFVPKRARTTLPPTTTDTQHPETDAEQQASQQAAERRKQAHDLAAATISRQLAEQRHSETQRSSDVDDTDGLDPEAEFEAWRQRELARLRRDAEALLSKRKEQAEIEQFKSLPEAEKERLGRERAAQLRAEKKQQRGTPAFMQKYYHKGSFFQDMDILKRDYSEKTTREVDVSQLPKMMQVRNYGVKGRSKWTHLANEDTSKDRMRVEGVDGKMKGCFVCGGPHLKKDCPEGGGVSGSGANRAEMVAEGSRKWGERVDDHKGDRERSRSPRRESDSRDHPSCSSRGSRDRYADEPSRRDYNDPSRSHSSRDDHKHTSSSLSRRDDEHRSHHSHRDDDDEKHRRDSHRSHRHHGDRNNTDRDRDRDRHRSRSDRNNSSDPKHKHHDDHHDRHKRRNKDAEKDRHHPSSSSTRRRTEERDDRLDRKRSRLET